MNINIENIEYIESNLVHTIPEKLTEYFIKPFTSFRVIIILAIMIANIYMFRKLREIKKRDYIALLNLFTIGIYVVAGMISAVLVSRLGPHGTLKIDLCDSKYMFVPRVLFILVAFINVICFIINIVIKIKNDKEYNQRMERGYYAEQNEQVKSVGKKDKITNHINVSGFVNDIKEKIDVEGIKNKVNHITEDVRDIINDKSKNE